MKWDYKIAKEAGSVVLFGFLMLSGGIERVQWHEIGEDIVFKILYDMYLKFTVSVVFHLFLTHFMRYLFNLFLQINPFPASGLFLYPLKTSEE